MTYEIIYGEHSLDRLFELLEDLKSSSILECVEKAMERLAADPVHHGVRGRNLHQLPDGRIVRPQQFDFHCDAVPGRRVYFRAHFYYGDDEVSLRVIKVVPYPYLR